MSTKTTFKRIALVTVAALGFGLMSAVAPATAADGVAAGSITLETSSLTVVQNTQNIGIARINLFDIDGAADTLAAGETITATVIGVPAVDTKTVSLNAQDISFVELKEQANNAGLKDYIADTFTASTPASDLTNGSFDSRNAAVGNGATTNINGVYALALVGSTTGTNSTLDKGFYTIRFRLTDVNGFVLSEKTMKVKFVTAAADSGAKIAVTVTGSAQKGQALPFTTNNNISVSLKNEEDGRVMLSPAAAGPYTPVAPPLAVAYTTSAGVVVSTGAHLLIADSGTAGQDVVTRTGSSILNGTYGVYATSTGVWDTATASLTGAIRVRYGATEATATLPLYGTTNADSATSTLNVVATGISVLDTTSPFNLPITTKSAVFTATALTTGGVAVTNIPLTFTVAYSGNTNIADVRPLATAVTTVMTDAFGQASFTVTNANPINTGTATVTVSGFTSAGTKSAQVVWQLPVATTTIISPAASKIATKSTTVVTATVLDQFGAPVAGAVVQPTLSGANAPTTVTASNTIPTVVTNAAGQVTYTLVDAAGVEASSTLGTSTVGFTVTGLVANTSVQYTYVATLPTVSTLTRFYDLAETTTAANRVTPVPVTGITQASGAYLAINDARTIDGIISQSGSTSNELVGMRFNAASAAGAAVSGLIATATITGGGYFVSDTTGLRSTTATYVTSTTGDIGFTVGSTKIGANTVTVTVGGATASASFWVANAQADARYVTMTGAATATANGALVPVTVTVTDRYGNPVGNVALSLTATGAAAFAGGATTQTYTTDAAGTFTFQGTSYNTAGGAGTFKASVTTTGTSVSDTAGYVGTTAVDSTLTAGTSSATLAVTFADGVNPAEAAANAATDAAAEATDAANAATDAANAAAEAADAATAAAQDAADAVAALSTQVSEMVNALKKQITALTNLVIKIQKKVRA